MSEGSCRAVAGYANDDDSVGEGSIEVGGEGGLYGGEELVEDVCGRCGEGKRL